MRVCVAVGPCWATTVGRPDLRAWDRGSQQAAPPRPAAPTLRGGRGGRRPMHRLRRPRRIRSPIRRPPRPRRSRRGAASRRRRAARQRSTFPRSRSEGAAKATRRTSRNEPARDGTGARHAARVRIRHSALRAVGAEQRPDFSRAPARASATCFLHRAGSHPRRSRNRVGATGARGLSTPRSGFRKNGIGSVDVSDIAQDHGRHASR